MYIKSPSGSVSLSERERMFSFYLYPPEASSSFNTQVLLEAAQLLELEVSPHTDSHAAPGCLKSLNHLAWL
jgi:hypothetical protein